MTDSGGLQEESTALGIPCLTLRPNTERPITVEEGTSTLVGNEPGNCGRSAAVLDGGYKQGRCPDAVGRPGGGTDREDSGKQRAKIRPYTAAEHNGIA